MSEDLTEEQRVARAAQWIRDQVAAHEAATRRLDEQLVTNGWTLHIDALTNANPADDITDPETLADAREGILACYRYAIIDATHVLAETFTWTADRPTPGDHPTSTASGDDLPPDVLADLRADLDL
ncbi:hypothetical protein [Demequina sp.]|uniref:hypothetical protein n=1 Tax=Demequina sp. TaxID=2050685 RepID=UPI003D0D416E